MPKTSKCKINPSERLSDKLDDIYARCANSKRGAKKYNTKNTKVSSLYIEGLRDGKSCIDKEMKEIYENFEDEEYSGGGEYPEDKVDVIGVYYDRYRRISRYLLKDVIEIVVASKDGLDEITTATYELNIRYNSQDYEAGLDEKDGDKLKGEIDEYVINKHFPKIASMFVKYTPSFLKAELVEMMLAVKNPISLKLLREIVDQME